MIRLISYGDSKIKVIKVIRSVYTGLGLKDAKILVEHGPVTLKEGLEVKGMYQPLGHMREGLGDLDAMRLLLDAGAIAEVVGYEKPTDIEKILLVILERHGINEASDIVQETYGRSRWSSPGPALDLARMLAGELPNEGSDQ